MDELNGVTFVLGGEDPHYVERIIFGESVVFDKSRVVVCVASFISSKQFRIQLSPELIEISLVFWSREVAKFVNCEIQISNLTCNVSGLGIESHSGKPRDTKLCGELTISQ